MADLNGGDEKNNGVYVEVAGDDDEDSKESFEKTRDGLTLYAVLHRLISMIVFPNSDSSSGSTLVNRIKFSFSENVPLLREASRNTVNDVLLWTRRGTPLRALLVISIGTITLLALTGLLVFMLFFLAATINAVVISLLVSLAAAGGFLALFFACMTAVYIGALSIAVFVISSVTISAIIAALVTTGWIGFFWMVWLAMMKSASVAKHSLTVTGSALSAYSSARRARHHRD